jgi:hypothetical protein
VDELVLLEWLLGFRNDSHVGGSAWQRRSETAVEFGV